MKKAETPVAEYMKIRQYVMTLILRAGKKSVRIPTVTELAQQFGVSRPTVCKAMKVLTDDGYIIARPSLGSFTNPARSALQGSDALPIVGILENDGMLAHYFPYQALRLSHIMRALAGIPVIQHPLHLSGHRPDTVSRELEGAGLDLLIWIRPDPAQLPVIEKLRENGLRVIVCCYDGDYPGNLKIDSEGAGYEIGRRLLAENRKHIIYLPVQKNRSVQLDGLLRAYREAGVELNPNLFLEDMATACEDLRKLLLCGVPVDAVFCSVSLNDRLFQALEEGRPDFRKTISLIRPDITDGALKTAPGYVYSFPFQRLAERLAVRVRGLAAGAAEAEQKTEIFPIDVFKNE